MRLLRNAGRWLPGVLGLGLLIGVWSLLSTTVLTERDGVPTPWATVAALFHDGWSFYQPNLAQTGSEALKGYLIGNGLALGCAFGLVGARTPLKDLFVQRHRNAALAGAPAPRVIDQQPAHQLGGHA